MTANTDWGPASVLRAGLFSTIIVLALTPVPSSLAQTKSEPDVLTNDTIVKMVRSHLGAEVIIEQIRTTPGNYSLQVSDLIKLKQEGVPDSVILAMQTQMTSKSGVSERPARSARQQSVANTSSSEGGTSPGRWQIQEVEDKMSGKKGFDAFMWRHTSDGRQDGEVDVTAICDPRLLNYNIVFLSDEKPGVGLKGIVGSRAWQIDARVRINDDAPKTVWSWEHFVNYMDITFYSTTSRRINLSEIYRGPESINVGDPQVALRARSLAVELTTENDVKHIFDLNPQDPSFQEFGSRCGSMFWDSSITTAAPTPRTQLDPSAVTAAPPPRTPVTALMLRNAFSGPAEKQAERTYRGNLDGFIATLPSYLQRAAAGIGAPTRSYNYEISYIAQAARQCVGITPQQAASVTFHNVIDVSRLGEAYRPCAAPYGVPVPKQAGPTDRSHPAELSVLIRPLRLWGDGNGISVTVSFTEVGFPGTRSGERQSCAQALDCGIAIGLIEGENGARPQ